MESIYEGIEFETVNKNGNDDNELVMFALSTCGHCRRAKKFLKENGVKYRYIYVDLMDYEKKQELKNKLQKKFDKRVAFPFLVVNGEKSIVGFLKQEYERYI
jgi:glutaredoxin